MSKKQSNSKNSSQEKSKGGRPTRYRSDFHPKDFLERSKNGESITEIAMAWDECRESIYLWATKHEEFSNALKRGKDYLDAWYCRFFKAMATGKIANVNVTAAIFLAKNAVKWTDRIEAAVQADLVTSVEFVDE